MDRPLSSMQTFTETGWDCEVFLPVLWGDQDAAGHVNHAVYLRWLEEVRAHWLLEVGVEDDETIFVAQLTIEYRLPVRWPGMVRVRLRAAALDDSAHSAPSSFIDLDYAIHLVFDQGSDDADVVALARTRISLRNTAGGVPLTGNKRERLGSKPRFHHASHLQAFDGPEDDLMLEPSDPDFIAGITFGETSTLLAPDNVSVMAAARAWISEICYRRKDQRYQDFPKGVAQSKRPSDKALKDTNIKARWEACKTSQRTGETSFAKKKKDEIDKFVRHFFMWPSSDGKKPRARVAGDPGHPNGPMWPFDQTPTHAFGPFKNPIGGDVPKGNDIYIFIYDNVK